MTAPIVTPACAHHSATEHAPASASCLACGHALSLHEGYPADTSCADWHSELPETSCDLCSCTWGEEPRPYPRGIR